MKSTAHARSTRFAAAAALGLLVSGCPDNKPTSSETPVSAPDADKECCMGKNDCKGQGGCAVPGGNDCAGKNECKAKGGCNMHCPK